MSITAVTPITHPDNDQHDVEIIAWSLRRPTPPKASPLADMCGSSARTSRDPRSRHNWLAYATALLIVADNAEDFKQGAKINKASVSRRECVGTLLKIPLC